MTVLDGDVWANGTWWDVDDDAKLLIHVECGQGFFGDDARDRHAAECPVIVTCPRCEGDGRIGWNPTSNNDPQYDEDDECPLCEEACVVTLEAAEEYLDWAAAAEDEHGRARDGWSASDYDPPRTVPALSWGG